MRATNKINLPFLEGLGSKLDRKCETLRPFNRTILIGWFFKWRVTHKTLQINAPNSGGHEKPPSLFPERLPGSHSQTEGPNFGSIVQ